MTSPGKPTLIAVGATIALGLIPTWGCFEWFLCRVEPANDKVVVVIRKTGKNPPTERVIAEPDEKGIQKDVLKPGARYFLNPFFYDWEEKPIFEVPQGKLGVLVRKFGREPSAEAYARGAFVVKKDSDEKGIVDEILAAGRYPLNPYAYDLKVFPAHEVPIGFVGVQTLLVGEAPKKANQYISAPGERGTQADTLKPGSYYLNPYVVRIDNFDVRTKRLELSNPEQSTPDGMVSFYSADGFEIDVRLTVTWQIDEKRAPEVFVRASTESDPTKLEDEIISKVLRPAIRGIARIEGSKFPTVEYINGASRLHFQNALLEKLRAACEPFGVVVHEALVNDITPPKEILEPIREREIAKEELARNNNQIKQAIAEQSLARTTALQAQETEKVQAETARSTRTIQAKNLQEVAKIDQDRQLVVATADLATAKAAAEAILSRGQADADVIRANNEAEAEPLRESVAAFKTGADYAAYTFAKRLAPAVHGVFADPDGPFGKMFSEALTQDSKPQPQTREGK
ncbi:MAG TPA: SPFH domain-containing protein [Planctomycetota bacterium]|nr:SPFH domain-containing protein [Planctomycetota bacterium]